MERPVAQGGATLHFVDDRFETLHAICEQAPDLLGCWKLYLADWGYCTAEERGAAAGLPGVRVLTRPQFLELLRWGVVMEVGGGLARAAGQGAGGMCGKKCEGWLAGRQRCRTPLQTVTAWRARRCPQVDDGCEPTREEVDAAARE